MLLPLIIVPRVLQVRPPRSRPWTKVSSAFVGLLLASTPALHGYESDQYRNRSEQVADSLATLDEHVNQAIASVAQRNKPPTSKKAFAAAVFRQLGGIYVADKIERWAAASPAIAKYPHARYRSIYRTMPCWATRVTYLFGVAPSIRVNAVMIGSDKLSHFVSQGFKYFKRESRGESREQLLRKGAFAERWIFGKATNGIYSNADLVANFEGWLFYKSLFEDDIIPGKPAILSLVDGRYRVQRPFTFADHINDYWDEALNPSFNSRSVDKRLRMVIRSLCEDSLAHFELYHSANDEELWQRYQHIGLRDARVNQFDAVCASDSRDQTPRQSVD